MDTPTDIPLPYASQVLEIPLSRGPLSLWQPTCGDAILDAMAEAPPDPDDKMPYWVDLWPSALGLAAAIDSGEVPLVGPTLELGSGLGLCGLAAARVSAEPVTLSDWIDEAMPYWRASAALNNVSVETQLIDWRRPPPRRWQTIIAADVLYEPRNGPMLYKAIDAMLAPDGVAWISDPGRDHVPAFLDRLDGWAVSHTIREVSGDLVPGEAVKVRIYQVKRL